MPNRPWRRIGSQSVSHVTRRHSLLFGLKAASSAFAGYVNLRH